MCSNHYANHPPGVAKLFSILIIKQKLACVLTMHSTVIELPFFPMKHRQLFFRLTRKDLLDLASNHAGDKSNNVSENKANSAR